MSSVETQQILDGLRSVVKAIRDASKDTEKKSGVSSAQLFVLQKIAEHDGPLSINDLARRTLTHQSSVSVVVSKLVVAKLAQRKPSRQDARINEVSLTLAGKTLIRKNPANIVQRIVAGIDCLSVHERQGFARGLKALIESIGIQEATPPLFFEEAKSKKKGGKKNDK